MPGAFVDRTGSTFFVINSLALSLLAGIGSRAGCSIGSICPADWRRSDPARAISLAAALHAGSEFALGSAVQSGVPQPGLQLAGMDRVLPGNAPALGRDWSHCDRGDASGSVLLAVPLLAVTTVASLMIDSACLAGWHVLFPHALESDRN